MGAVVGLRSQLKPHGGKRRPFAGDLQASLPWDEQTPADLCDPTDVSRLAGEWVMVKMR